MSDLPPGWEWTTLGEVAETSLGKMLDRGRATHRNLVPYLRNANVKWGRIDLTEVFTISIPVEEQEYFRLRPGDLLVCEGGEIGRCAIWLGSSEYMAFQKALHRVRPLRGVSINYLRYLLEHLSLNGTVQRFATGSTIKHLPQEQLRQLPIMIAPTSEQHRIVAELEECLSRLDAGVASLTNSAGRVGRLWDSVCSSMTLGTPDGDTSWPIRSVGDVTTVQGGLQKQPKRRPIKNRFPFLRVANISRGGLNLSEIHEIELFDNELEKFRLQPGDLLVVEGNGSMGQIGRAAMWRGAIRDCVHQNHLIRVRPGASLDPCFLELLWNAPVTAGQLHSAASSTSGLYTLSTTKIKAVQIPVPPLDVQQEIVREAEKWNSSIGALRSTIDRGHRRASALRRSVLADAFSGRLVPQDPTDEPASELLARIRTERPARAVTRPVRRMTRSSAATTVAQQETLL